MSKAKELQAFIEQVREENKTDVDRFVNDLKPVIKRNISIFLENKHLAVSLGFYSSYFGGTGELIWGVHEFESFKRQHSEDYYWCELETAKNQLSYFGATIYGERIKVDGIPVDMYEFCKKLEQEGFELWFVYDLFDTYDALSSLRYLLLVL